MSFNARNIILAFSCVVLSTLAFAENGWRYEKYALSDYSEAEHRLKGGNSGAAFDGDADSKITLNNNGVFNFAFDAPVDLSEIRIYTLHSDSGRDDFGMSSIQIQHPGESEYETLDGSELALVQGGAKGSSGRVVGAFTNDVGLLATRVSKLKVNFGAVDNGWVGLAELEVIGEDSVTESINPVYTAADGVLSATIGGTFAEYPVDIYCVRGNTDAGDDYDSWSEKVLVGTIDDADSRITYGPDSAIGTDCRYLRFTCQSKRYGNRIWAPLFVGEDRPSGSVQIANLERTTATASVTLFLPGLVSSSAAIYAAVAEKGGALPEATLVRSNVGANTSFEYVFTDLTPYTEYVYRFRFVNANRGELAVDGEFKTRSATDIENTIYTWDGAATGTWTSSQHWIASNQDNFGYPANTTYASAEVRAKTPVSIDIQENVSIKSLSLSGTTDLTLSGPGKLTVTASGYYDLYGRLTAVGNCFGISGGTGIRLYGDIVMKDMTVFPTTGWLYTQSGDRHIVMEGCNLDRSASRPICYGGGNVFLALTNSTFKTGGSTEIGTNAKISLSNSVFHAAFDPSKFGGDIVVDESYMKLYNNGDNFGRVSIRGSSSQVDAMALLTLAKGIEITVPKNGFEKTPLVTLGVLTLKSGSALKVDATAVKISGTHTLITSGTLTLPWDDLANESVEVLTRDDCEASLAVENNSLILTIVSHCTDANNWKTVPRLSKTAWGADEDPATISAEAEHGEVRFAYDGSSSEWPTTPGHHTVRVFVPGNEDYDEISAQLSFDILEAGTRVGPGCPEYFNVVYSWQGPQGGKWSESANWMASIDPTSCNGVPSNSTLVAVTILGGTHVIDVDGQFPIRAMTLGNDCDVTFCGTGLVQSVSGGNEELKLSSSRILRTKDGAFTTQNPIEPMGGTIVTENSTRFPTTQYVHSLSGGKLVFIDCHIERNSRGFCSGTGTYCFTNSVFRMYGDNELGSGSRVMLKDSDITITHNQGTPQSGTYTLDNSKWETTGAMKPVAQDNFIVNASGTNAQLKVGTDLVWKKGALNVKVGNGGFTRGALVEAKNLTLSGIDVNVEWQDGAPQRFRLATAGEALSVDVAELASRFTSTGRKHARLELSEDGKTVWAVAPIGFMLMVR